MFGRSNNSPQAAEPLVISRGGFFNGNVIKSKGDDAAVGPRPVHLVDGARAVTTQQ